MLLLVFKELGLKIVFVHVGGRALPRGIIFPTSLVPSIGIDSALLGKDSDFVQLLCEWFSIGKF